ncbi:hypothetical protein BDZ45DRAFT_751390 [Acephala macrosclerotiorum]|nr:hypothetical protein BDZ45DRAFT_751390 [Acephala macrosclerotiorum]
MSFLDLSGKRGQKLAGLCFYECASQVFTQTFAAAARRSMCFLFETDAPTTRNSCPSLGQFYQSSSNAFSMRKLTRFRDTDNAVQPSMSRTQDEVDETLFKLFYPWNRLLSDFRQDQLQDFRAAEYKNTYIWNLALESLPSFLFNDYLETTERNTCNDEEVVNIELDFSTLLPTQYHLLQTALDIRGDVSHGTGRLRVLLNPLNTSTHFCDSVRVKEWARELQPPSGPEAEACDSTASLSTADQSACLIPSLDLLPLSTASLPALRAI